MSEILQPGHPDADQLNAFLEDALPAALRQQTLAHLAVCADCRMVVMLASGAEEFPAPAPLPERSRRWWQVPVWQWSLPVAAAAALVLALFTVHHAPPAPAPQLEEQATAALAPPPPAPPQAPASIAKPKRPAPPDENEMAAAADDTLPLMGRNTETFGTLPAIKAPPPPPVAAPIPQPGVAEATAFAKASAQAATPSYAAAPPPPMPPPPMPAMAAPQLRATKPVTLPSGLAVLSSASDSNKMLALDAGNHLFLTRDGGAHWQPVSAQWGGRAVRVGLVGAETVDQNASSSYDVTTEGSSSLTGLVRDQTGAAIAGAVVTVTGPARQQTHAVKADASGRYLVGVIAPGSYTLTVDMPGFTQAQATVAIPQGTAFNQNVTLQVGSVSQTVQVQSAPQISASNATVSNSLAAIATAPKKKSRAVPPPVFELSTESGEKWVSSDGLQWMKQ